MIKQIINIPDLGEAEDVEVIEICVVAGDQVNSEDPIALRGALRESFFYFDPLRG